MKLSLIGMSGAGKSYWARRLQKYGWKLYCCDELIAKKLAHELPTPDTRALAAWMGRPYDVQYTEMSKRYLLLENQVLHEILDEVESNTKDNIVIDTTGSVIYTDPALQSRLQSATQILYLLAHKSAVDVLYQQFLREPKPIIWGDAYAKKADESNEDSLSRCYKDLLSFRMKKYQDLAYFSIKYDTMRRKDFSVESFINLMYCV